MIVTLCVLLVLCVAPKSGKAETTSSVSVSSSGSYDVPRRTYVVFYSSITYDDIDGNLDFGVIPLAVVELDVPVGEVGVFSRTLTFYEPSDYSRLENISYSAVFLRVVLNAPEISVSDGFPVSEEVTRVSSHISTAAGYSPGDHLIVDGNFTSAAVGVLKLLGGEILIDGGLPSDVTNSSIEAIEDYFEVHEMPDADREFLDPPSVARVSTLLRVVPEQLWTPLLGVIGFSLILMLLTFLRHI